MFPLHSGKHVGANGEYFGNIPRALQSRNISRNESESSSLVSSDQEFQKSSLVNVKMVDTLESKVGEDIIGHNASFLGPFGWRKCK